MNRIIAAIRAALTVAAIAPGVVTALAGSRDAADGPPHTAGPVVQPAIVTERVPTDSDDPAIWVHPDDPARSLIIGNDKNDPGGLYVFDLDGRILPEKTVTGLRRPNNVDIEYGLVLGGEPVDVVVTTERYEHQLRVFSLPDMTPVDGGGLAVFVAETGAGYRLPMGIALYRRPDDGAVFAIVGRKSGPRQGYLWQYRLEDDGTGRVAATLVREFGTFSGTGEIEAIAVDDVLGYVYCSDEAAGIRKYHADPADGDEELALFGTGDFAEDREGICIYPTGETAGYILVSDQQANGFNLYPRQGAPGEPHRHELVGRVTVAANESDGSEASAVAFNDTFRHGLFVAMSDERTFHFYRWEDIAEGALGVESAAIGE
ncbi:phytase [bacterium]|nr:phytase [bacterium]